MLKAVEQLNETELETFISQIIILHTQKKSGTLIHEEVELYHDHLENDNKNTYYYSQLITKTQERMTFDEYKELLRLSEEIDKLQAHRFEYIAYLANLHGISLTELMTSLGFHTQ